MFVYELSGCRFESRCSHLNFRYRPCFEQGVPWHSGKYRVWIHSEMRKWHNNMQSIKIFITKNLRKAIMKWWALERRANISNKPETIKLYKQQRNYVVNLIRKVKREHYQKHMPHSASSKIFANFANHSFQIKH